MSNPWPARFDAGLSACYPSGMASEIYLKLTPERRSPEARPPKGKLYLVVKADESVVIRNWEGTEASIGITPGNLIITGTLSPDATGTLVPASIALAVVGEDAWSSDGTGTPAVTGSWVQCYPLGIITPTSATIDQIVPKAGYISGNAPDEAANFVVLAGYPGSFVQTFYWLYDNSGNPKWVNDGTLADRGGVTIDSGKVVRLYDGLSTAIEAVGGLLATWTADAATSRHFRLNHYTDGGSAKTWYGDSPTIETATLTPVSPATGTPSFDVT